MDTMAFDRSTDDDNDADLDDVLLPGTALFHGQYRVGAFLNSGGFGITYLAKDNLNRDVVLKECFVPTFCRRSQTRVRARSEANKPHLEKAIRGFMAEAQILAALSHPNIVRVHQVFEDNDTAYMALEYIKGHDLLEIIDEKKASLTPDQIVTMARKLVSAVAHIHDQNLLHCDISPDNICIRADGEPVLIDFGSARKTSLGIGQKHTGFSMVKDGYSPQELYATGGTCGPYSDIYSLGASLYHAVMGKAPVDCQSRISAIIEGRPDPVKTLARTVTGYPPGFLAAIDKALAVQPSARHQSAGDWLEAIAPHHANVYRNVALLRRVVVTHPVGQPQAQTA
jgi:serine/threonine protein kinase